MRQRRRPQVHALSPRLPVFVPVSMRSHVQLHDHRIDACLLATVSTGVLLRAHNLLCRMTMWLPVPLLNALDTTGGTVCTI
jgi:hypothetical protein